MAGRGSSNPSDMIIAYPFRSILGVPWFEMGGKVSIDCEKTGYTAQIEFLTKVMMTNDAVKRSSIDILS